MIRTFLAFELPEAIKQEVITIKQSMINISSHKIKWVEDENLHITLQFIGDIKESDVKLLDNEFAKIFTTLHSFEFELKKLELVPGREPKIIWLKFENSVNDIFKTHKKIKSFLNEKGYKLDKKPLKFHLTLGRIKRDLSYDEINDFIKYKPVMDKFFVDNITFFKSFLTPKGPIYTPIGNYELK